jgi:hypothetical protein
MTVNEFSQVYGFTVDKKEFLKLLLAKLAEDPHWAGEVEMYDSVEDQIVPGSENDTEEMRAELAKEAEWTHEGKVYDFMDFAYSFRLGSDKGQERARELFPELPAGVKLFHNPLDHNNTWHLGIEVSHRDIRYCSKMDLVRKTKFIDPAKLVTQYKETLHQLIGSYGHLLKEKSGCPVLFEVTDDCDCCS